MTHAVFVTDASQVADARRRANAVALGLGFDAAKAGNVAIVATELATNLLKHGGGGELLIQRREHGNSAQIELVALDRGPGIVDLGRALADGHSTAGSPGNGLGAIARLSTEMEVYAPADRGTAVLARLGAADPQAPHRRVVVGGVAVPMPGEAVCGDAWCLERTAGGAVLMVADGLGHGPVASTASRAAVAAFQASDPTGIERTVGDIHAALRRTRGAAVALARVSIDEAAVRFCGIGNIAGLIASHGYEKRMVSMNGTAGANARTIKGFSYDLPADGAVVLASDGLATGLSLAGHPGLLARDPTLIAAVLYRDFGRGRDDATAVVVKAAT